MAPWPPGLTPASSATLVPAFHTTMRFYTPCFEMQMLPFLAFPTLTAKSFSNITSSGKVSLILNSVPSPASL